jgi:cellulose synthase/poly-beta-1,6-N-acetylglucosamine synthase-like glycosyltransferase
MCIGFFFFLLLNYLSIPTLEFNLKVKMEEVKIKKKIPSSYDLNEERTPILSEKQFDYSNTPVSIKRPSFQYKRKEEKPNLPMISIITTIYKNIKKNILLETKQSIENQSFQSLEWIIVYDGVPKRKYLESDQSKSVELKKNLGLPGRN